MQIKLIFTRIRFCAWPHFESEGFGTRKLPIKMRCFCIHVMNDLDYYYAFVERANLRLAWLWVDPTILNCADKISNQNGFGTVHLLLLNVQWDLDWELRILWQDWPLKSTQIGKNDIQFSANFFVSYSLSKHVCSIALSLLFHLKSWFAQKLNYATAFARVQKQYLPRNVNITFALIEFHMRCFLQLRFTVKC